MKIKLKENASLADLKRAPKQLAVGLAIMLLSSLAGGVILSTQNQTETLLVLNRDVAAGDALAPDYFVSKEVLVSSLNGQWLKPDEIDPEAFFTQSLAKGDLLRAADVTKLATDGRLISFSVPETNLPANMRAGDQVDFWEISDAGAYPIASKVALQTMRLIENQGLYQVTFLVDTLDVQKVLEALAKDSLSLTPLIK